MSTPLDDVISLVANEEQHFAAISECFLYFAALAETRHLGYTSNLFEALPEGLPTECDDKTALRIHNSLIDFMEKCPSHPQVISCFRILFHLNAGDNLKSYLLGKLKLYYGQGDAQNVFQICIVLEDMGMDIFRDENGIFMTSRSASDAEINLGVARRLLECKMKNKTLASSLLRWFSENARDLPWRRTRDPYGIWISEIMLQQTQVKTVIPYWERWMRELPTVRHLAEAPQDRVLKLWEGLGYYTRARNLQKAAQVVLQEHAGVFPRDHAAVLALPGIGPYTAGAICSIAYNQPTPILDGNVIRVLTRIHGIAENPRDPATNKQLWALATELVNTAANLTPAIPDACSHLNQSLMELGALICSPRQPNCLLCPVRKHCVAYETGQTESLPNLGERAAPTARRFLAFVLEHDGRYLVQQRPAGVVNAHLWEFPNLEASPTDDATASAKRLLQLKAPELHPLTVIKHSITRYRITLEVYRAIGKGQPAAGENGAWKTKEELAHLAFTSAHGKIRRLLEREKPEKKPTKPRS